MYNKHAMKPTLKRWNSVFNYIESQPGLVDIVVSGGDAYYLTPEQLAFIGERLINMPNIKKIRFASKGLAVCPNRILDPEDGWTDALIYVHEQARKAGKRMALHTHFSHPNEISWVTELASKRLVDAGVTVRNQTVLLRGVNDNVETMGALIRTLADTLRIQPVRKKHDACLSQRISNANIWQSTMYTNATWFQGWNISEHLCRRFSTWRRS
jgi:lysine 2,3-aminomutase